MIPASIPDRDALRREWLKEAEHLAQTIVATRQAIRSIRPPDRDAVRHLCRCYDRLDDLAEILGAATIDRLLSAAKETE